MPKITIRIKDITTTFKINKKPSELAKLIDEAEKHFDFTFGRPNGNTRNSICNTGDRISSYFVPAKIMTEIRKVLPDFDDLASLELVANENGDQNITKYDCSGAMLAMVKAYDSSFDFKVAKNKVTDFNEYLEPGFGSYHND